MKKTSTEKNHEVNKDSTVSYPKKKRKRKGCGCGKKKQ